MPPPPLTLPPPHPTPPHPTSPSPPPSAGLAAVFGPAGSSRDAGCHVYEARRSAVLPPLAVRRARVEDHDDMLPVMQVGLNRIEDVLGR